MLCTLGSKAGDTILAKVIEDFTVAVFIFLN